MCINVIIMNITNSHPGYFGKVGMRHYHLTKNMSFMPTMNIDKIWSLVKEDGEKKGSVPVVDCTRAVCNGIQSIS